MDSTIRSRPHDQVSPARNKADEPGVPVPEERLPTAEVLYQALSETIDGLVYVCDSNYRLLSLNSHGRKRAGSNAVRQPCYRAIHQRMEPCPFCVRDQVLKGQTVRFEMVHPDQRWYASVHTPVRSGRGDVCSLVVVTDIETLKKAQAVLQASGKDSVAGRTPGASTERHTFGQIVGKSPSMQMVYEQIGSAAATDATTIIYGEPGTGKELVAHAIHELSQRRRKRFVPVHCGAIPENLVESEFFGYMKGAFSGADADKPGYVDFANGGTLFLDEVGEIRLDMQIKLLRVIEGTGFTPVGSSQVKSSDIRIIAATNRDLHERIARGLFREDFYYRIHILPIHLPPLRQRKQDLPLLIDHFIRLYGGTKNPPPLTADMMAKMIGYDWPGNVRELQNVIIRLCSLHVLELGSPPVSKAFPPAPPTIRYRSDENKTLNSMLADFEKQVITQVLSRHHWHRSKAAKQLGIDRKTLFSKIRRYRLE